MNYLSWFLSSYTVIFYVFYASLNLKWILMNYDTVVEIS